jgi:hypothetical protein
LNWADFSQPVNELCQTADHPVLSSIFAMLNGGSKRRIILADLASPRGKPAENTRHKSSPDGLHDIWAMFFLILSQDLKLVLLM